MEEAREMAKDAIRVYLEALLKEKLFAKRHPSIKKEKIAVSA
jgi:predicted RNase H-like HicB family nuclease